MKPLQYALRRAGHDTILFSYRSYWRTVPQNAEALVRWLGERNVPAGADFVTFSMGGIVLRWAVNRLGLAPPRRVVMIAPPNGGASMADWMDRRTGPVFPLLFGRSARLMRTGGAGICEALGPLPEQTSLGIIAGGTGRQAGFNPLLGRDNDRVVAVEEAKLDGMSDFLLLPIAHGPLLFASETARQCDHFLRRAKFAATPLEIAPAQVFPEKNPTPKTEQKPAERTPLSRHEAAHARDFH
jgi:hypothetical protein